ncbi:hypothetical protein M433DRAFT_151342 [Acidomyces richmondensis BFW]|nr:MAG: hypothetical protein FE78DRAFT_41222 [Acidomyces sp. 'richmondensis']KYG48216.1 hypothetical protein M433DRAFT_151342 [Acidomyces richmondensis BFW]
MMAITQINDGQIQAPTCAASQISDGQPQVNCIMTAPAVSQIMDGQPQAPTATAHAVSQISDAQPQAPVTSAIPVSQISDAQPQAPTETLVSQISDAQPQAPTAATSQANDGQPQASGGLTSSMNNGMVACQTSNTLAMTLANGVLKDSHGRTGYIASNYQFQFDDPPQAGAIYTAGFSVCGNGSLALGGSTVFYQCLSGDFYNLYNEDWAPQCSPITINAVQLVTC